MRLGLLRFKSSRVQRTFESLSKLAHGRCRRLDARVEREAVDRERGAEVKQGGAAEGLLGAVVETRRHDLEPQVRRERGRGAERDAGGPCLEGTQLGIAVGSALRKNGDRAPSDQDGARHLERLGVLREIPTRVLAAVHRDRLERPHDEADDRHPEQRCLREERHPPRRETQEEGGIDEPIRMVEHEDDWAFERHPLYTGDLDAAEEDPDQHPQQGTEHDLHTTRAVVARASRHPA